MLKYPFLLNTDIYYEYDGWYTKIFIFQLLPIRVSVCIG